MEVSGSTAAKILAPQQQSAGNKRSRWVAAATALQALWALTIIGVSLYLLFLARGRSQEQALGLRIAAGIVFAPGLLALVGWFGLWNKKRWGWWFAQVCDWGIVATMVYAIIDDAIDGLLDWSLLGTTLLAMIVPILLLFPAVRRACRNPDTATSV